MRTTTPDRYSAIVQIAVREWRAKRMSSAVFGAIMHVILQKRGMGHV